MESFRLETIRLWTRVFDLLSEDIRKQTFRHSPDQQQFLLPGEEVGSVVFLYASHDEVFVAPVNASSPRGEGVDKICPVEPFLNLQRLVQQWGYTTESSGNVVGFVELDQYVWLTPDKRKIVLGALGVCLSNRDFHLEFAALFSFMNLEASEWKELWASVRLQHVSVYERPPGRYLNLEKPGCLGELWVSLLGNVLGISSLEVTCSDSAPGRKSSYLTELECKLRENSHLALSTQKLMVRNFTYSASNLEVVWKIILRCASSVKDLRLLARAEGPDQWPSEATLKDWSQALHCCTNLRSIYLRLPEITSTSGNGEYEVEMATVYALARAFPHQSCSGRVLAKLFLQASYKVVKALPSLVLASISQIFFQCLDLRSTWEDLASWCALGKALRNCPRLHAFHFYMTLNLERDCYKEDAMNAIAALWLESQHSSQINIHLRLVYWENTGETISRWTMNSDNTFIKSVSLTVHPLVGYLYRCGAKSGDLPFVSAMKRLANNRSITCLSVDVNLVVTPLEWDSLVRVLRINKTIKHLALEGFSDDRHLKSLVKVLKVHSTLESIVLKNQFYQYKRNSYGPLPYWFLWDGEWFGIPPSMFTDESPLPTNYPTSLLRRESINRYSAVLEEALARNRKRRSCFSILSRPQWRSPKVKAGRLFLCGAPFAGKTRLSMSMLPRKIPSEPQHSWLRTGRQVFAFLSTFRAQVETRTTGIEVQLLHADDSVLITIWDLAGQWIYRTIQDLLFPRTSQPCIFVFVFSPMDARNNKRRAIGTLGNAFRDDLLSWLRFIASNSQVTDHSPPQVLVVISHKDCVQDLDVNWARRIVDNLRATFKGIVDLCEGEQIYFINSSDEKDVNPFSHHVLQLFEKLMREDTYVVPEPCSKLTAIFASRPEHTRRKPVWYSSELYDFYREKVGVLLDLALSDDEKKNIMQAVSLYLHDVGSIILIPNTDLVIVDPSWLTHSFLGELMNQGREFDVSSGVVSQEVLDDILGKFRSQQKDVDVPEGILVQLLKNLDLCYQLEDGNHIPQYFMPSLGGLTGFVATSEGFESVENHPLSWNCNPSQAHEQNRHEYCGFRLQCEDRERTLLTASFFPRFQVRLRNKLKGIKMDDHSIICRRGTVKILVDGHQIFVESDGPAGDHIDIMIKSSPFKPRKMALVFVKNHIIDEIRKFCALPEGCPGVSLTLGILRPQCVEKLTPLAHRGDTQAISLEMLRKEWLDYVADELKSETIDDELSRSKWMESLLNYAHWWPEIREVGMEGEFERARNLLWEDDLEVVKAKVEEYCNQHLQDRRPSPRAREDEVIQISDELYEVYAPMSPPEVELVFVHGLQEDICDRQSYLTAWSTLEDRNVCWLNTLLPRHLNKPPRVISVSCDASCLKTATKGRLDMYLTAENLVKSLIDIGKVGQRYPVVLVGHSLGGLVITELCNQVQKRDGSYTLEGENAYRSFLRNVKGLFYYSTPFKGSLSEVFVQECASAGLGAEKGDLMESLQVLDKNQPRRNHEFDRLKNKYGWTTGGVVESNVTTVEYLPAISSRPLVEEASARAEIVDGINVIPNTDHFTICRPETEKSNNFLFLVNFVHALLDRNVHKK